MRYVPYGPELDGVPNVIVDGRGNDATVLALSHWPGNATPRELRADVSAGIVLKYLQAPDRDRYRRGAEAVSNNHYDIDGLVSLWAMLNPAPALPQAELLVAVAECGDFARWSGEHATRIVCALRGLESMEDSQPGGRVAIAGTGDERTATLYREMLTLLPDLLDDAGPYERFWQDEYRRVEEGRSLFAAGAARVQEVPELDLAIFYLPCQVHDMALHEQTACTRVALLIEEEYRYEARYRYESWVELESRTPPPRIDLRPLADFLQAIEGNDGDWVAGDVTSITPRLSLRGPDGAMSPSSLTPGLFRRVLTTYLADHADDVALHWSPYSSRSEHTME